MVGDLPFLKTLGFYHLPNVTGLIPSTITKLSKLEILTLTANKLTGPIPDFLRQIKTLQHLDLSNNRFFGTVPSFLSSLPNIFKLELFSNKLTGTIPESFGSFKNISLDLSDNHLSGAVPRSLGHANLTYLSVGRNKLTGDVSFLFARDKPLKTINLSRNKFKFDFTNVDLPHGLELIYISQNMIYGSLPKRLGKVPLYSIDVSRNQLCGPIPTGLQAFSPSKFAHNKCLCGVPLPPCKK
ncbi:hypothetical protein SOVF_041230 [Spinacia oleracea]|nr:hypothetical protein SOVF_041230 [Spinacia oleracea]